MIIVKLQGGMGNQMFQYATGRALSLKYGVPLGLDLSFLLDRTQRLNFHNFTFRNYDLDVFNIEAEIVPKSKIPLVNRTFGGSLGIYINYFKNIFFTLKGVEKGFNFDPSIFDLGHNVYLDGFWQSPKYFEGIKDIIRKDFVIKKELSQEVNNLMQEIKNSNSLCIHVRRGDYLNNSFHNVIGKKYYNEGIEFIKEKTHIDNIYVFSDDIKWCEENMSFPYNTVFVGEKYAGAKAEGNLALMSACKYFIISNSTFSWWGAWLSDYKDKIVIAPKQWFADATISNNDLIPQEWVRI